MRKLTGFWRHVVTALSVMLVLFQLYTAGFGVFPDIVQRSVHLFFVLTMLFLLMPANKKKKTDTVPWYDVVLSMICMVCTGYMILIYEKILWDPSQWINSFDKICAVLLTILILEGSRRAVGLTIPMMKDAGYSKEWSAAISAVGSTGGQIMPPIMGAGAFIMAQLIGLSYLTIAKAAIVPALLYYMGAFVALHYLSKRLKIFGEGCKEKIRVIEFAIIFVPLAVFIAFLAVGYTVTKAAFYATVVSVIVTVFSFAMATKNPAQTAKQAGGLCMKVAKSGAESILGMAGLLAGAQISIALISQTGFGVKLSSLIMSQGGNYLFLCLLLSMVVCFILGMGLPPTAAYVLAAAILAPALISLGLDPLVAHLFVFYFANFGAITPPVCAAVFLSSGIAESNWLKTGGLSVMIAIPAFVVPFTFAYNDALMLSGSLMDIVLGVITSAIGVYFIGLAIAGFMKREMSLIPRALMFVGGIAMIVPHMMVSLIGLALCIVAFVFCAGNKKQLKEA